MTSSVLFTPVRINRMTLKNRIIMPAMASYHAAVNGEATEKLLRYHEERAKGGVGMNIVEATYVARSGNSFDLGLGISDDFMIKGLSKLTEAVHRHDGKIAIQLQHGGRFGNPPTSGCPRLLVSMIPGLAPTENSRVMDADDIEGMVGAYVQAARRAVEAGFDAVEIHGAHGYLINQFMSPLTNRREDAYGGSFENRMRFPLEVLRAVRKQVGPGFPILFRYSMEEFMPGGIDMEQAVRIARVMADNGVDMLNVSIGIGESVEYIIPPASVPDGWNADRAAVIKQAVGSRIPVAVVGRICNRKTAEGIIASGKADLVAMGRALLADPFLPAKLAEGRDDEILTCIGCNEGCTGMLNECRPISCALNPRTGYEDDYPMTQADAPTTVVVSGGGPAGCEAALTAAQRGHKVVLFEASPSLGGLANIAALPPGKGVFATLGAYFSAMLPRAGVDVRLNTKADADAVRTLNPDHVIVATGGAPIVPRFCADAPVVLAQDILTGTAQA
ncbi:MAG: FAD-dependent oxidoreductase, partial [Bilophila wadsworthia]